MAFLLLLRPAAFGKRALNRPLLASDP